MIGDEDSVDVYMPWFLGDYWRDTGDLTCTEHGAYLQLLGRLWNAKGYLTFEPARLAQTINLEPGQWPAVWATIGRFFTVKDGRLSQKRGLYELRQARLKRQSAREKAQDAANARWSKGKKKTPRRRAKIDDAKQDAPAQRASCPSPASSPSTPTAAAGGKRARSRLPTDLDIALAAFCAAWKRRYRQDYIVTDSDRSQLGRLLPSLTAERARALPAIFDRYLADTSKFVVEEKRHSLAWFLRDDGANKYSTAVPVVSAKEARNAVALGRFLETAGSE